MNNENSTMRDIMNRIKNRRSELNMSYQELATKTNITKSTLQRYETGSIKNMPLDKLELVANALDISPAYLMGWEDINNKNVNIENKDTISIKERKLLNNFNKLNETGKDEAIKRVSELTLIPSYIKEPPASNIKTIAAHNDHLTEHGEMDKVMQDIEDMDNW
ncbi:transcriptional regulator [Clostridium sp. NCR]|nr:transcriptional regulator [Clostridium sp. NCR]